MNWFKKLAILTVAVCLIVLPLVGCAPSEEEPSPPPPAGTLTVTPKVELAFPGILKSPPVFSGSGWPAKDMILVEIEVPSGVVIPALEPGENAPLGCGYCDESGNFEIASDAVSILFTFFRTYLIAETMSPNMEEFDPIPLGTYTVVVSAIPSGASATGTMELVAPPPKE